MIHGGNKSENQSDNTSRVPKVYTARESTSSENCENLAFCSRVVLALLVLGVNSWIQSGFMRVPVVEVQDGSTVTYFLYE